MKKIRKVILLMTALIMTIQSKVLATGVQSLKIYSGTLNLLRDATTALMIIVPVSCGLCILFFQWRKSVADTQEQPMWSKRTKVAIISLIIGFSASGIVNLITTYYSG